MLKRIMSVKFFSFTTREMEKLFFANKRSEENVLQVFVPGRLMDAGCACEDLVIGMPHPLYLVVAH